MILRIRAGPPSSLCAGPISRESVHSLLLGVVCGCGRSQEDVAPCHTPQRLYCSPRRHDVFLSPPATAVQGSNRGYPAAPSDMCSALPLPSPCDEFPVPVERFVFLLCDILSHPPKAPFLPAGLVFRWMAPFPLNEWFLAQDTRSGLAGLCSLYAEE